MAKKNQQKKDEAVLTIDWNTPENIITRFATHMVVQTIENEFKVSFFEVKPAIVFSDEDKEKMRQKGTVRADCVGSVIITADRLPKFIEVLNKQLSIYNKTRKQKES